MANCTQVMSTQLSYTCSVATEPSIEYYIHTAVGDIGPRYPKLQPEFIIANLTS